MDKILTRKTVDGKSLVFVADSINKGSILCWEPGHDDLKSVTLDFYHTVAKYPMEDKEAKKLAEQYKKAFGVEIFHMVRLPRNYRDLAGLTKEPKPTETVKMHPKEASHYAAVMLAKDDWQILDEEGNAVGFAPTEKLAKVAMQRLAH